MNQISKYENSNAFFLKGDKNGVLLIHGFSGSNTDLLGIAEFLHGKGMSVHGVKLAGHGTSEIEMEKSTLIDWEKSVHEGYELLSKTCDTIFVIGYSMGALLASELSIEKKVKALICVSPALLEEKIIVSFIPFIRFFKRWYTITGGSNAQSVMPPYKIIAYKRAPVKAIPHLYELIRKIRMHGNKIIIPILIIQGKKDGIIPSKAGKELYALVGSKDKQVVFFENSGHSVLIEDEREEAWRLIYTFIRPHLS